MQENEFEKRVQNRLAGLSLVPNEEVWKQVEARIRKEKRRRLIFYWLLAGLFLTGGTGTLIFLNHNNTSPLLNISSVKKPVNDQKISDELLVQKPAITKKDEIFAEKKDAQKRIAKVPKETLQSSAKTKVSNPGKTTLFRETPDENSELPKAKQKELILSKKGNEILGAAKSIASNGMRNVPQSKSEPATQLSPHKYYLSNSDQKPSPGALQKSLPSTGDKTSINDSTGFLEKGNAITKNNPKTSFKKWKFGITIYGGVSDNVDGIGIVSAKSFLTADQSNSFASPTSGLFNSLSPVSALQYKTGASFGAGVYVQKALTRKLNATVGVNYHYMSARSTVGNKVNSTLNVYDSLLQKPTVISLHYRTGQTTSFSNKYHLVQLPLTLQWQLNKNINKPLSFAFGLAPSFLISSNALYANSNARAYYREKKQFNHFMLFGQSELLYTLSNRPKYRLQLGPALQYDFNSFSKTATRTKQHLIFTGLKTSITLK